MNANKSKNGLPNEANDYSEPRNMDVDETIESDWKEVEHNFNEMNLKEELMHGISVYGLEKLSAIQQHAILPCIKGQDVIVQAQSGTGKTATFSISILQQIDTSFNECQALILVPTLELAQEIKKVNLFNIFNWLDFKPFTM